MAVLAKELAGQNGVRITFHTTALGRRILRTVGDDPFHILLASDDPETAMAKLGGTLAKMRPDLVILDNYFWNSEQEAALKPFCERLCVVDDLADRSHSADILIDQNPNRQSEDYRGLVPEQTLLLVGAQYCLLAKPFRTLRSRAFRAPAERNALRPVFVSLGGGDPNRDIVLLVRSVLAGTNRPVCVVTGSHIDDAASLTELATKEPRIELTFDSTNVAQQMNNAAYAVASGGTMTWERAILGLPSLSLIAVDNQYEATKWLEAQGAHSVFDLRHGWSEEDFVNALQTYDRDDALRARQSIASAALIDGKGADRLATTLLK
ncbi:UDP-2,4-diacetamido-2,4,6-trideoxy-beta-L-altropyranose hydrolase [Palleronia caenipelagi]|nr:UDP-2,4-diacetamido-2,4,6-trideoxy-beta-L-altropyranose hydrolase [Palleronia caenipelagi]